MAIRPEPDETYDDWMIRCADELGDETACDLLWGEFGGMTAPRLPAAARAPGLPALALALEGSLWLAEAVHFRPYILRALSVPGCPSGREIARARRRSLEWAKAAPTRAVQGTGVTDPSEEQLTAPRQALRATKGKVVSIPIYGPVGQRMSGELMKSGGTSMEDIGAALEASLRDKAVEAVVLEFDSPGGTSYGTEELADRIFAARGQKKIYASCNSLMCSAAYWLGTSAEQVMITPGGDTGSVGVYVVHADQSKALEQGGVTVSLVGTPEFKTEGNEFQPLTEEAAGYLREQVNATYDKFVAGLRRNRGVPVEQVRTRFGRGRMVNADRAVEAGMADRIITYPDLIGRLTGMGGQPAGARAAGSEVLRLRHEHRKRQLEFGVRLG